MQLSWDDKKKLSNELKHGLSFEDAYLVFEGETVTFHDDRFHYGETRLISLGQLMGRTVIIVHTPRDGGTRIISMRKANEKEKNIYKEQLKKNR